MKTLTEEQFREGYRKAQLIDVREPNEFDNGHILGARNIPMTQMKMRLQEIRPDKPVYLYCQSGMRSGRAAQLLYKKGYKDLSHLQGGFKKWTGKVKRSNTKSLGKFPLKTSKSRFESPLNQRFHPNFRSGGLLLNEVKY